MKITNCTWEIANIGKKTCEILIDNGDTIEPNFFHELDMQYEYQVVKVASGNVNMNILLENNGFHLIETQIDVELKQKDFDNEDRLVKFIEADLSFKDVSNRIDFEAILEKMTPNMFVSDRVALDPNFGLDYSYQRYRNWMITAFNNNSASFYQMLYKKEHVGFSMYRLENSLWHGDLGGAYPAAGQGLGIITACGPFLYMKQRGIKVSKLVSSISSNNGPVISTFNHCHYNFKNYKYVFVKHNDN